MDSSLEFSNSLGSSLSSLPARCRTFKIIVVGDSGVGKTCLAHRFCAGEFPSRTEATIGVDFRERLVEINGEKIKLQLWDTAGQERFRKSMIQHYYRNVHAVLFVYDVTRPASFSGLSAWIEECRQNSLGQDIPRFLVGNKSDLREHGAIRSDGQVNWERAHTFAEAHGMTLFETSAKSPPDRGTNGRGGDKKKMPCREDKAETIVIAVAARLAAKRQRTPSVLRPYYSGSFKLPAKKSAEKDLWACTC